MANVSSARPLHPARVVLLALTIGLAGAVLCQAPAARTPSALALQDGVALTPPMGWNSWYWLGCDVTEADVERAAYAMVSRGMRDAGYTYVNLDDCWQGPRADDGTITSDPQRFPDGIQSVIDYVHSLGLKFGLYTDAGSETVYCTDTSNGLVWVPNGAPTTGLTCPPGASSDSGGSAATGAPAVLGSGCVSYTDGPCVTQCVDGQWSSSTGSGTCSGHGGEAH